MPGTTTNAQLRYPVASDAPDGAGAFYNLAQDVEDRFARSSIAANGTFPGQKAYVGTGATRLEYVWSGTAWDLVPIAKMLCDVVYASTTAQAFGAATWTALSFDTVVADPFGIRTSATNYTLPWNGRYSFEIKAALAAAATGRVMLSAYNSGVPADYPIGFTAPAAQSPMLHRSEYVAAASSVIQARVYQDSASNNIFAPGSGGGGFQPRLIIRYLGPQ